MLCTVPAAPPPRKTCQWLRLNACFSGIPCRIARKDIGLLNSMQEPNILADVPGKPPERPIPRASLSFRDSVFLVLKWNLKDTIKKAFKLLLHQPLAVAQLDQQLTAPKWLTRFSLSASLRIPVFRFLHLGSAWRCCCAMICPASMRQLAASIVCPCPELPKVLHQGTCFTSYRDFKM